MTALLLLERNIKKQYNDVRAQVTVPGCTTSQHTN
nr:MAG TPA: hypothetical protein [Bacteriophage sp.]